MWLIASVSAAAAAALMWWRRVSALPETALAVANMRQASGVVAAIINMVNAVLDALMLLRRVVPGASSAFPPGTFSRAAEQAA